MNDPTKHKVPIPDSLAPAAGWSRALPIIIQRTGDTTTIRVLWLRLLGAIVIFGSAGYASLVASYYSYSKYYRGVTQTQFLDLLLPSRWPHHQVTQGDHFICVAEQQLESRQPLDAVHNLRVGLAKSPDNLRGRLLLAQLYASANRFDLTQQTLLDGLPALNSQTTYLQSLFGFLLQQQLDELTLKIARDLLQRDTTISPRTGTIALAAASASYFRGNYDQAEDFLSSHRLDLNYDGRLLSAQIDWERGYRELALFRLTELANEQPGNESAAVQLASWYRELGRNAEYRRLALVRQLANPANAAPRIDLLYALSQDGEPAKIARESTAILHEFSRDQAALATLADFAANTGDSTLARRVYDHSKALGLAWEAPAILTVEALVVARDYRGALELTRDLLKEHPGWARRYYSLFNSLQSVAYYGLGDSASAQLYLANFLGQANLRADNLLAVARRFTDVGARTQARQILAQAAATDPLNQAALTGLIRLDLESGNLASLPDNLRRLVAMRKPSVDLLRDAQRRLGSDLLLFSPQRDATLQLIQRALATAAANARNRSQ